MEDEKKKKKPLSHLIPATVIEDFNHAVAETGCRSRDATEAAVRLWLSLSNEQRALLNVRVVCGKSVTFDDIDKDTRARPPDVSPAGQALADEAAAALESKGSVRKRDRPDRSAGA